MKAATHKPKKCPECGRVSMRYVAGNRAEHGGWECLNDSCGEFVPDCQDAWHDLDPSCDLNDGFAGY